MHLIYYTQLHLIGLFGELDLELSLTVWLCAQLNALFLVNIVRIIVRKLHTNNSAYGDSKCRSTCVPVVVSCKQIVDVAELRMQINYFTMRN